MYHVAVNGIQQGPLNETEIRERISRGELKAADLCWLNGWPEWKKLGAAFPDAFAPPPLNPPGNPFTAPPPPPETAPVSTSALVPAKPQKSGLATASLICGICAIVLFPLFFLFIIPAVVCGHMAHARIKRSNGALLGEGKALTGLIMGYVSLVIGPIGFVILGMLAAMAIPAFQKVRTNAQEKMMDNDARQIAAAAQQYFLETGETSVALSYNSSTGAVGGPLANYVKTIGKGYTVTPERLAAEESFELGHPALGPPRSYGPDGTRQ